MPRRHKPLFRAFVLMTLLLIPGLQPGAEALIQCSVDSVGVWLNSPTGRFYIRVHVDGVLRVWALCNSEGTGNQIAPGLCQSFLDLTVVAGTTKVPLVLTLNDSIVTDEVAARGFAWDGTCLGIVNFTNLEPALMSFQLLQ